MQEDQDGQTSGLLDMPREAAKDYIRDYVLEGWTLKELISGHMSCNCENYAVQIGAVGGYITDQSGKRYAIKPGEIIVTRYMTTPLFARFSLAELVEEIKREHRQQRTLADVFIEEEEAAARQAQETKATRPAKKRAAPWHSYQGGTCLFCGEPLGFIEVQGGRTRLFCDNKGKCKQAYHRQKEREAEREAILKYNTELRDLWQEYGLHGETLYRLQTILLKHGKAAAVDATNAVIVAIDAQRRGDSDEKTRLIDEIMLWGEANNWPELKTDDFYIGAGLEAWSIFVGSNPLYYLRMVSAVVEFRQGAPARRQRLAALSKAYE